MSLSSLKIRYDNDEITRIIVKETDNISEIEPDKYDKPVQLKLHMPKT